jgi:hypothetical protein
MSDFSCFGQIHAERLVDGLDPMIPFGQVYSPVNVLTTWRVDPFKPLPAVARRFCLIRPEHHFFGGR